MLELAGNLVFDKLTAGFSGDTYNAAVYAKRWNEDLSVSYMTAVGKDSISRAMRAHFQSEKIDQSLVYESSTAIPGAYLISADDSGERTFTYWRKGSAATKLFGLISEKSLKEMPCYKYVYFSGISLAILDEDGKGHLIDLITTLRSQGSTVVFDPNYRDTLWSNKAHAMYWIRKAYSSCDIALPGIDDHKALFRHSEPKRIYEELAERGVIEVVIKCGVEGIYGYSNGTDPVYVPFSRANNQVDTTAAGDSFAGTYLAVRSSGHSVEEAINAASDIARTVVQHSGAILSKSIYYLARNEMHTKC